MKEASGTTSTYLRETFQFLENTFANLRELKMSEQLISDAIFATYQHIGFSLLEKLIDERKMIKNILRNTYTVFEIRLKLQKIKFLDIFPRHFLLFFSKFHL